MTPDQIRREMASLVGLRPCACNCKCPNWLRPDGIAVDFPDYPNDLTAVARVVGKLSPELIGRYRDELSYLDRPHGHGRRCAEAGVQPAR